MADLTPDTLRQMVGDIMTSLAYPRMGCAADPVVAINKHADAWAKDREELARLNGQTCGTCASYRRGEFFAVCGIGVRQPSSAARVEAEWGCRSWTTKEGA